jgi:hypothetical protein
MGHLAGDPCKQPGCGHAVSAHNLNPDEKRARDKGIMLSDYPSARRDSYNYNAGPV